MIVSAGGYWHSTDDPMLIDDQRQIDHRF